MAANEQKRFEQRLQRSPELNSAFVEMQHTRSMLRSLPSRRAPRSFTLTPQMVGTPQRKPGGLFSFFALRTMQVSAALSSLLLIIVLIGDFLTTALQPAMLASAPQPAAMQAPVQEESLPPAAPAAPLPTAATTAETAFQALEAAPTPLADAALQKALPSPSPLGLPGEAVGAAQAEIPATAAVSELAPAPLAEMEKEEKRSAEAPPTTTSLPTLLPPSQADDTSLATQVISPSPDQTKPPTRWGWRLLEIGLAVLAVISFVLLWVISRSRRAA